MDGLFGQTANLRKNAGHFEFFQFSSPYATPDLAGLRARSRVKKKTKPVLAG
jgi:hypothetical protein